jgi:hypothetical protein
MKSIDRSTQNEPTARSTNATTEARGANTPSVQNEPKKSPIFTSHTPPHRFRASSHARYSAAARLKLPSRS